MIMLVVLTNVKYRLYMTRKIYFFFPRFPVSIYVKVNYMYLFWEMGDGNTYMWLGTLMYYNLVEFLEELSNNESCSP